MDSFSPTDLQSSGLQVDSSPQESSINQNAASVNQTAPQPAPVQMPRPSAPVSRPVPQPVPVSQPRSVQSVLRPSTPNPPTDLSSFNPFSVPQAQAQAPAPTPNARPIIGNDQFQQMRQTMDDATIMHNIYHADPAFKAKVDNMKPYYLQQNVGWQQQFPTWALNKYYGVSPIKLDKGQQALANVATNPPTQQPWFSQDPNTQGALGSYSVDQARGQGLAGIGMGLYNMAASAGRFGLGAAKTIGQGALGVGEQALSGVTGNDINDPFNSKGVAQNVEGVIGNAAFHPINTLNAIKDHYVNTYGSSDAALKKIFEDPAGFLSDVVVPAQVATGGLSLAGKLGFTSAGKLAESLGALENVPGLGKVGNAVDSTVSTAGNLAKNVAGKVVGAPVEFAKGMLGSTTGAGKGAIDEALQSTSFKDAFHQGMKGDQMQNMNSIVDEAQRGLDALQAQRSAEYMASKANVAGSAAQLDPSVMGKALTTQLQKFGIQGGLEGDLNSEVAGMTAPQSQTKLGEMMSGNNSALDFSKSNIADTTANNTDKTRVTEAVQLVKNAMTSNDPYYKTPLGWDTVKKQLGSLVKNDGSPADGFITGLKNNVRDTISSEVPEYGKMMSAYEEQSQNLSDMKKAFSLQGGERRAALDTVVRKLTSSVKTGNQGNEIRNSLLNSLEESTGVDLKGKIAGAAMAPAFPRGLAGAGAGLGGGAVLGHVISPSFLLALPFTSPRVVGELMSAIGIAKNAIKPLLGKIPSGSLGVAAQAANYANPPNSGE